MRKIAIPILLLSAIQAAHAASPCRAITDDKSRLQCYDAEANANEEAPAPQKVNPFIITARAAVKRLLRDPASAQFTNETIKTIAGRHGLCGDVNSKNAAGGRTGPIPYAFDGMHASIMAWDAGASNGTSFNALILSATLSDRLQAFNTWCKTTSSR